MLALMTVACSGQKPKDPPASAADSTAPAPADSLALTINDSTQLWFVAGRADTAETGAVCQEHLLELRHGDRRTSVPLLYTMAPPTRLDDTTLRAALYRHCAVASWYQVDVRTGLPRPER
jgi:hypothetical protein